MWRVVLGVVRECWEWKEWRGGSGRAYARSKGPRAGRGWSTRLPGDGNRVDKRGGAWSILPLGQRSSFAEPWGITLPWQEVLLF